MLGSSQPTALPVNRPHTQDVEASLCYKAAADIDLRMSEGCPTLCCAATPSQPPPPDAKVTNMAASAVAAAAFRPRAMLPAPS